MATPDPTLAAIQEAIAAQGALWTAGRTSLSDLSLEQLRRRTGYVPGPGDPSLEDREALSHARTAAEMTAPSAVAAAAWDWREVNGKNFISTPKDQGACGSCVAFGVAGAVEARAQLEFRCAADGPVRANLSEAQLFYCFAEEREHRNCQNGWWNKGALQYLTSDGITDAQFFPYVPGDQGCALQPGWEAAVTQIESSRLTTQVAEMKEWISRFGPVVTAMVVYADFRVYQGGVYRHVWGDRVGGHSVTVIGYSDPLAAWVCKNSWGTGWGEGGFFYIAYGECGIDAQMEEPDGFVRVFGELVALGRPALLSADPEFHVTTRAEAGAIVDRRYDKTSNRWTTRLVVRGEGDPTPATVGDPATAQFNGRQYVVYRAAQGELWLADEQGGWAFRKLNLGGLTGAPAAADDPAVLEFYGLHLAYLDQGGALWHLWYEKAWNAEKLNLGDRTTAPAGVAGPVLLNYGNQLHVTYRGANGEVWDLWYHKGWHSQKLNLGGLTAAPAAAGVPAVYVYRDRKQRDQQHVTYCTPNGEVWDLWFDGRWRSQMLNLNGLTPAPPGVGNPTGGQFLENQHVIWRTVEGVLWSARYDGSWSAFMLNVNGLTEAPRAAGDPVAAQYLEQLHVTYRDQAGELWDVYLEPGHVRAQRITLAPLDARPEE